MTDDLITMIEHSRRDMGYGENGSFNREGKDQDYEFDTKDAKKVIRAIDFIKRLILGIEK